MSNSSGYARSNSAGPGYQPQQQAQGGYPASVYSVDRGYTPGMDPVYESETGRRGSQEDGNGMGMGPGMGPGMGFTPANPYLAASDHLGLAPPPSGPGPSRARTLRNVSSTSDVSTLHRTPTTSIGSSKAKRKGISAAIDVTKPPYTKEFVDDYRARMKMDPDPEAQFAFARYLIEAARKIGEDMSTTDPRAGKRYRDGLLAESLKNLKRLAAEGGAGKGEGGYPEAQFFLANMFGTGQLGLQVDHEKAYQLYMQASKANHPAATYRTAVCNELGAGTRKEMNRAVLFYRKAAALKDTAAMYKLAMILLMGSMGQARNPNEGVVWLRRAASQADEDNPHALHELAMIYEDPRALKLPPNICPPSIEAAREHYTEAAQLGYAPSMYKLGVAYEHGHLGCPVDPRRSIAWLSRAAEKGDPEAALALSGWFLTGAEGVLKQDDQEAFLWARKAANKGLPKAEFALGRECRAVQVMRISRDG
jgi:TPR repeat protein